MRYCHECGAQVNAAGLFCAYCGTALQPADHADAAQAAHVNQLDEPPTVVNQKPVADSEKIAAAPVESNSDDRDDEPMTVMAQSPALTPNENTATAPESSVSPAPHIAELPKFEEPAAPPDLPDELQPTLIGQNFNQFTLDETANFSPNANAEQAAEQAAPLLSSSEPIASNEFGTPIKVARSNDEASDESNKNIAPLNLPAPPAESQSPALTPGSKARQLKSLDEGQVLNHRYEIVRRIGGGGMGAVYLAHDRNLGGVQRAVKEMIQAHVDESQQEKAVADFRRESLLLSSLDHPAIPTIYDYFYDEDGGRFYLVMKYIAGGDLSAKLRAAPEGRLDEANVTAWAIQIADVLDYLHNLEPPIIYRDLKPSNIMLDAAGRKAMLVDFGIARWVNKEEKGVTAVGTMGYAPPELFAGTAEARSDIYSLGATMFHLLTGSDPQNNPLLIFDFTKNKRPRSINPMLSVEMEDILLRAVEYNAVARFESAEKMRDALQQHLDKMRAGKLSFDRRAEPTNKPLPPPPIPQPNLVFCGFCGEKIIATDTFCAYCGTPQTAQPKPAAESSSLEATMLNFDRAAGNGQTAKLVVVGTNDLNAPAFALEKESNLIGREDRRSNIFPEVDLTKYDSSKAKISRRHARVWRENGQFMVEDLKSANGTILIQADNQSVRLPAHEPHVLHDGDQLKLGETTLRFTIG